VQNREIEVARRTLEERADQLALSSKYKSEFLANMSHELRTPLNSLLILARLLSENSEGNLTPKQVEFATTIHNAGQRPAHADQRHPRPVQGRGRQDGHQPGGRPAHEGVGVRRAGVPAGRRAEGPHLRHLNRAERPEDAAHGRAAAQQILKNLLSNAMKFTEHGEVALRVAPAGPDVRYLSEALSRTDAVLAFAVTDTGIGVPEDKLRVIFEAFQQADGTTSRKYGGTGLGLSISREISRLLGGEIHATSEVGKGSTSRSTSPRATTPRARGGRLPARRGPRRPEDAVATSRPCTRGSGCRHLGRPPVAPALC
jgi:signal transduction histidine kinase